LLAPYLDASLCFQPRNPHNNRNEEDIMLSRRRLLATVAPAAVLAGCGTTITNGQVNLPPAVIDFIVAAVAFAAKYVPTVESIAATAAALFGPAYVTAVTIGSQAINAVIAYLSNLVAPPPTPSAAQRRLAAYLKAAAPGATLIGYTRNGIPIYGYPS
jgi:hypothetical protein